MILSKKIVAEEELINVAALSKLVSNYCKDQQTIVNEDSIENLILELNIIKPDVTLIDVKPLILVEVVKAVANVIKNLKTQNYILFDDIVKTNNFREYVAISTLYEIDFIKMTDINPLCII